MIAFETEPGRTITTTAEKTSKDLEFILERYMREVADAQAKAELQE
jgi:hypothetical protein